MLERLTEQRRVITDIMLDERVTKKNDKGLLPKEDVICDLSTVLRDLTDVTTFMSTEQNVFCSHIYSIVCGLLRNNLSLNDDDSVMVRRAKETLGEEIERRFQPAALSSAKSVPVVAALLIRGTAVFQ